MPRRALALIVQMTLAACCLAALCLGSPQAARAESVRLPVTLGYPFLRASLIQSAFTGPGQTAVAAEKDAGCTLITLSDPRVGQEDGRLVVTVRTRLTAGVSIWGKCLQPVEWQGQVRLFQRVWVDPESLRLRVRTEDSRVLDPQGEPTVVAELVWSLIREHVHGFLDQFTVNLRPPVQDLDTQLPLLFRPGMRREVRKWLATLRPAGARVEARAVRADLVMEVEPPPARPRAEPPAPLSPAERDALVAYWEAWDAYLVHQLVALAKERVSREDADELFLVLLENRHGFLEALRSPRLSRDLVREQFLAAWQRLAPLLRRYLLDEPSPHLLNYLAFFTAGDALEVLDRLGPHLGLEISREGLMRLARLVKAADYFPELEYGYGVDRELRELLRLGEPPAGGAPPVVEQPLEEPAGGLGWLVGAAWAAAPPPPPKDISHWRPPTQGEAAPYLARVEKVLQAAVDDTLDDSGLAARWNDFFQRLILASAWQESCWRQFHHRDGRLTYLVSYNNTSVGLMQINERVWRGMFEVHSLRWDIGYNARAGCQIMENYLRRYALKRLGRQAQPDLLARTVYAMYNGGPGQVKGFPRRLQKGDLHLSDRLFWKKYQAVKAGDLHKVAGCLVGE
jgi:hypothetical protein